MKREIKVIEREEFLYMRSDIDFLSFYKNLVGILEEYGFEIIKEPVIEWWTKTPKVKPTIEAVSRKDPYTRIQLTIKYRFKKPHSRFKSTADTLKIEMNLKGEVITEYPEKSAFQRSFMYRGITRILDLIFYRKEVEKYKEECEELTIELSNRAREIYNSVPSIGKSKREYYSPPFR